MNNGDHLLCRGNSVYVPNGKRDSMMNTLHLTHRAPESMLACANDRVYWPSMCKHLNQKYQTCKECSMLRISKTRPSNEVSQRDLFANFYPNSYLQADSLEQDGQDFMLIVCTFTGYW